jgi:hypothetical protein
LTFWFFFRNSELPIFRVKCECMAGFFSLLSPLPLSITLSPSLSPSLFPLPHTHSHLSLSLSHPFFAPVSTPSHSPLSLFMNILSQHTFSLFSPSLFFMSTLSQPFSHPTYIFPPSLSFPSLSLHTHTHTHTLYFELFNNLLSLSSSH